MSRTLLAALAASSLLLPAAALGQDSSPRFGGCNSSGQVCAGPTVSVALVGYDLKGKKLETGIMPGVGYQLTLGAKTWHPVGLGIYGQVRQENGVTAGMFSFVMSFAQYVRLGLARDVISSTDSTPGTGRWLVVGGLGVDL